MPRRNDKRVAVVSLLTHPGGVQSCALALIRGLNGRDIVPDVLWDAPPSPGLLADAGTRAGFARLPFRVPTRMIQQLPMSLRYLAWIGNVVNGERFRERYDMFYSFYNGFLVPDGAPHLYYLSGPPLLPQLERASPGLRGAPYRCFRALYRSRLHHRWPAYEYHRQCRYVINSEYTAGLFRQAHGISLPVVYPAIDLAGRRFEADDLPRRDTITFFSRIVDDKRPVMVLDLARRHPQLRCVLMGGVPPNRRSYLESLRRRARETGVEAVILPNPDEQAVRQELKRTRFYIFPAIGEHFGMTTPEAIATGAVPFVHDSGGQREIVPDERLRFCDESFHAKFDALVEASDATLDEIRQALNVHIRRYSADVFTANLLSSLDGEEARNACDIL